MTDPTLDLDVVEPASSTLHVYRTIYLAEEPIPVNEIARRTNLSREAIRQCTSVLLDAGEVADGYNGSDLRERQFDTLE